MIMLGWVGSAWAGATVGVTVGPGVPLDRGASLADGLQYQAYLGDRVSLGPVHLQPEVVGRWNDAADAAALGAGGAVTVSLGPVALGPYGHVGIALSPGFGPAGDAGLLGEVTLLKPLFLGVRAGWQRDRPPVVDTFAARGATNWLVAGLEVGLVF